MTGIRRSAADRRFSVQIRERDSHCMRCGSQPKPGGLHCAHMFTRRTRVTRFDPDNALALCYGCHQFVDSHAEEKQELWRSIIGDEKFDALAARAHGKRDR
jgi:hypothetical protein